MQFLCSFCIKRKKSQFYCFLKLKTKITPLFDNLSMFFLLKRLIKLSMIFFIGTDFGKSESQVLSLKQAVVSIRGIGISAFV